MELKKINNNKLKGEERGCSDAKINYVKLRDHKYEYW